MMTCDFETWRTAKKKIQNMKHILKEVVFTRYLREQLREQLSRLYVRTKSDSRVIKDFSTFVSFIQKHFKK